MWMVLRYVNRGEYNGSTNEYAYLLVVVAAVWPTKVEHILTK